MKKWQLFFMLLIVSAVLIGCNNTVDIDGEKAKYDELTEKVKEKENELDEITDEFVESEELYRYLLELEEQESEMKESIELGKENLEELEQDIKDKEKKLKSLEGEILEYADKPIKINPGYYYFGIDDIDPGRYKIMAQDGEYGNVFIRGDRGSYVAETFGDGKRGSSVKEFTFMSSEGDEIEATIPILLYPVE